MSQTSLVASVAVPPSIFFLSRSLSLSLYHLRHEQLGTTRCVNAKLGLFHFFYVCAPYMCASVNACGRLLGKHDVSVQV